MANLRQALVATMIATGATAALWMLIARRRAPTDQFAAVGAVSVLDDNRTRGDEIETLTQQQKDLLLRELSEHI